MAHKCPNCKAVDHHGYCPACARIYRKVNKWTRLFKNGSKPIASMQTPMGLAHFVIEPDSEVIHWLTDHGKMPDLDVLRREAGMRTVASALIYARMT